jgi:hypothetical protein
MYAMQKGNMMDEKNGVNVASEERVAQRADEPDVKQALIVRRGSLSEEIKELDEVISQTQAEYSGKLEKLQIQKRTLEEALRHIVALLRFEGHLVDKNPTGQVSEANTVTDKESLTDAAYRLLTDLHEPLHYKEITLKLQKKEIHIPGKDPAATLLSRITRDGRFKRTKRRGMYAIIGK